MGITSNKSNLRTDVSIFQNPLFWLTIIVAAFVLIRLQYLGIPFERDEGAYALYGQQILDGGIPYVDFHAMKYPFIFYLYAGIEAIFGTTLMGVQTGFLLITTANVAMIYFVARHFFHSEPGLLAAAAYAILSFNTEINGFTCQSEHGLVFFMLMASLLIIQWLRTGTSYWLLMAGFLAGLSFQIKQTAALLVFFLGLLIIVQSLWKKKPEVLKALLHGGLFTMGFVLCLGIFAAVLHMQDAWSEFVFWTVTWPQIYLGERSLDDGINDLSRRLSNMMQGYWPLWTGGILALGAVLASNISLKTKVALTVLFVLSLATVVPGLRFYGHYWIQLLPAFAITFGVGMRYVKQWLQKKSNNGKFLYRLFMLTVLLSPVVLSSNLFFDPDHTQVLRKTYGMNPFPEMKEIGEYLKPNVQEGETLAIFGSEPELYFYTNTRAPSSYSYFSHLVKSGDESQQWQRDFLDSIEAKQPRYIVYLQHTVSWNADKGGAEAINGWATDYLNQNYYPVGIVDLIPDNVRYVFGNEAAGYQPKSSGHIYVLQRRY